MKYTRKLVGQAQAFHATYTQFTIANLIDKVEACRVSLPTQVATLVRPTKVLPSGLTIIEAAYCTNLNLVTLTLCGPQAVHCIHGALLESSHVRAAFLKCLKGICPDNQKHNN